MGPLLSHRPHLLLAVCILTCPPVGGLFEWLKNTWTPPTPPTPLPTAAPAHLTEDARFEMTTADEKFLSEAKQLELGPLDSCHYKVVARLKSSCESLSEENLAKLGVELFNCQAQIEGRRTFPCAEETTIRECTADMDPDTWNAYHIVSNRARSVCYATRQQLFRRRAELTVNALISTASSQLDAMKGLKEGQLELKQLTAASLDKLLEGHGALQAQQGMLHRGQEQMESSMKTNLERLSQEKALIASGQELLAQLIQSIMKKMENVSEHLQIQSSEVEDGHKAIVEDLAGVRRQARDIYQRIDQSVSEFLQYQDRTSQYHADLMDQLERMNSTLGFVLRLLDDMQSGIEERLHVIQGYLGCAGLSLTAMWSCVAHTGYLVLGAVLLTFLRCSRFSRALLLLVVPLNAAAEVNQQPALDLSSLSLLLLAASLARWFVTQLWARFHSSRSPAAPLPLHPSCTVEPSSGNPYPPSSTPQRDVKDDVVESDDLLDQDRFLPGDLSISAVSTPPRKPVPESRFIPMFGSPRSVFSGALFDDIPLKNLGGGSDAENWCDFRSDSRSASPAPSLVTNSSLSGRHLCNGTTKTGKACKKRAVSGQEFCRVHEGGHASYTLS